MCEKGTEGENEKKFSVTISMEILLALCERLGKVMSGIMRVIVVDSIEAEWMDSFVALKTSTG